MSLPWSTPAPDTSYDAIVHASGAAGLTSALTLAQQGAKVALLEKNAYVGGYAHGDGEQGFYWAHGAHILLAYRLGMQPREALGRVVDSPSARRRAMSAVMASRRFRHSRSLS